MNTNKGLAYQLSDEDFTHLVAISRNCADLMRKLGFRCTSGNSHTSIKRRIKELGLDISHWAQFLKEGDYKKRTSTEKYFSKGVHHSGGHIRNRILKENLMEYKCALCGNTGEWNGKILILQIDHINGDHDDNRLENLRFLCPNCHSQTDTFAGKNLKKEVQIFLPQPR